MATHAADAERPELTHVPSAAHAGAGGTTLTKVIAAERAVREDALATVERACALANASALFARPAGDAPREMDGDTPRVTGTGEARVLRVMLLDGEGRATERLRSGESFTVAVTFRTTQTLRDPIFGVALFRADGTYVFGPNTRWDGVLSGDYHGVYTFFVHYPELPLLAGGYRVSVAIYDKGHVAPHVWHNQLYGFEIVQDVEDHGLVRIPHAWGLITHHEER